MNWYFEALKKYAVFSGRARRKRVLDLLDPQRYYNPCTFFSRDVDWNFRYSCRALLFSCDNS